LLLLGCGGSKSDSSDKGDDSQKDTTAQAQKEQEGQKASQGGGKPPESKEKRIANALKVIPEDKRDSATVLGHTGGGPMDTLQKGSNEFICLADDPEKEGFGAACYHKELEAFMRMGRKLARQGKSRKEKFQARKKAIESGRIEMPDKSTLYVMSGEYDDKGNVVNSYTRYVVYIPYATPESTGLPKKAHTKGGPWIMNPGTHKAHIMVNPAKE
jgi:hypothetical protein